MSSIIKVVQYGYSFLFYFKRCSVLDTHFPKDVIRVNGTLIDGSEIVCQGVGPRTTCNERIKIKNIKTHLAHKHDVKSNLKPYRCLWSQCTVTEL